MADSRIALYRRLYSNLTPWRNERLPFMIEVDTFIYPNRMLRTTLPDRARQQLRQDTEIITSFARLRARDLRSALLSGICPQSFTWQYLYIPPSQKMADGQPYQDNPQNSTWLFTENEQQFSGLSTSNFYPQFGEHLNDAANFRVGATLMELDYKTTSRYTTLRPGSYMLGYDEYGYANRIARDEIFKLNELVSKFGLENISRPLQEKYKDPGHSEDDVAVIHVIGPNEIFDPNEPQSKFKKWSSCWFEAATDENLDKFLCEEGFDAFPVLVTEWPDCPSWNAMSDIKQLYRMELDKLEASEMMIRPPTIGPPTVARRAIDKMPGGHTEIPEGASAENYIRELFQRKLDPTLLVKIQDETKKIIADAYFSDTIVVISNLAEQAGHRTAYEISQIKAEQLMKFGPVTQSFSHTLDCHEDLLFMFRMKLNIVPQLPPSLGGAVFKPDYVSVLSQAQKMSSLQAAKDLITEAGSIFQQGYQDIWDKINPEKILQDMVEKYRLDPAYLRSDEAVAALRQARQASQQQLQAAQSASLQAKSAQALGSTPANADSLLAQMVQK